LTKSHLRLVAPATEKRTVTPRRRANADLRTREYLRIPVKATMDSDAWRPLDPVDDDQGGA